jgi:predicted O-methyltransferase YrrM
MVKLADIIDNSRTDKNTVHSYLDLYDSLMSSKKDSATNILEVGIARGGGSIKLWNDYFLNARIHGLDIIPKEMVWRELHNLPRVSLHTSINAYDRSYINKTFLDNNVKFDVVLDDGPHSLESMIMFISIFTPLLKDNGILIIEDVQDIAWLDVLVNVVPSELKQYVKTYDLRGNKGRYDDIVFTINKS